MSKVLMIISQENFRDEELFIPREMLQTAGHEVKVASLTRAKAKGMLGAQVAPDMAVHEANPDFFDAVIVVGGSGSLKLADSPDVQKLLFSAFRKGKILGAICLGPVALAKSGVLSGKRATVFRSDKSLRSLKDNGAEIAMEDVVRDGNIVTACGPEAANEFGKALAGMLEEKH